jgi:anti-sigma B factor antagonist
MALEIKEREREGVQIVDLDGRITMGPEISALREKVQALAAAGVERLILNLAKVDYIDSTGLGGLVICYTTMKKAGGTVKLLNLNRRNIELLLLTKLTTVLELFDDEQDAVNSFYPDREIKKFDILSFIQASREK